MQSDTDVEGCVFYREEGGENAAFNHVPNNQQSCVVCITDDALMVWCECT